MEDQEKVDETILSMNETICGLVEALQGIMMRTSEEEIYDLASGAVNEVLEG